MRQKIAIWVLLVFCFAEIRPLLPFVEYYLNYEYISIVLCINKEEPVSTCDGKCYLNTQLKKAQETDNPSQRIPNTEWEKIPMISCKNEVSTIKKDFGTLHKQVFSYEFFIRNVFISPPKPPPKC